MEKQTLRRTMLKRLKQQKEVERLKKSDTIKDKVFALDKFKKAKIVLFFASFNGEVETYKMIKEVLKKGKQVCLPCVARKKKRLIARAIKNIEDSLEPGPYTVMQPRPNCSKVVSKRNLDLIVVPGLAFDCQGYRLGRGGGYYDRYLANMPKRTHTVGVCFDFQIISSVPRFSHDLPVKQVISA